MDERVRARDGIARRSQGRARASTPRQSAIAQVVERLALLIAWVAVIAFFSVLRPDSYPTWGNFSTILGSQAVLVVITLGLMIPLTAGDFDLSVASVLTLSQMLIGILNVRHGWPVGLAIVFAVAISAVIGLINAVFILFFRIPSLIVTLGTGTFINGVVLWISASQTIGGISDSLVDVVVVTRVFGVPLAFYYGLALTEALVWYVFEFTALGRRLLFVGRGREVARLNGIRVDGVRLGCLVASSVFSALAGTLYAGMTGSADPTSGLELSTACIRRGFPRRHQRRTGPLQPLGFVHRRVFAGQRDYGTDDARHRYVRAEPLLWRCAGPRRRRVAARPKAAGARIQLRRVVEHARARAVQVRCECIILPASARSHAGSRRMSDSVMYIVLRSTPP